MIKQKKIFSYKFKNYFPIPALLKLFLFRFVFCEAKQFFFPFWVIYTFAIFAGYHFDLYSPLLLTTRFLFMNANNNRILQKKKERSATENNFKAANFFFTTIRQKLNMHHLFTVDVI